MKSTPSSSSFLVMSSLSWSEKLTPSPWLPSRRVVSYTKTRAMAHLGRGGTKKPRSGSLRGHGCRGERLAPGERVRLADAHSLRGGNGDRRPAGVVHGHGTDLADTPRD